MRAVCGTQIWYIMKVGEVISEWITVLSNKHITDIAGKSIIF